MSRRYHAAAIALAGAVAACGASPDANPSATVPSATNSTGVTSIAVGSTSTSAPSENLEEASTTAAAPPLPPAPLPPSTLPSALAIDLDTIEHVAVLGDSLYADLTEIGGRNNQVVPLLRDAFAARGIERVDNLALPGQSMLFELGVLDADRALLAPYVRSTFGAERAEIPDLVLIGVSSSDINTNAARPVDARLPVGELADAILDELTEATEHLDAMGAQVVVVPIIGISDVVFAELRCALRDPCEVQLPDAQIADINARMWSSDLPMLRPAITALDIDGIAGSDTSFFRDVDPNHPDDGVHPNQTGQRAIVADIVEALL